MKPFYLLFFTFLLCGYFNTTFTKDPVHPAMTLHINTLENSVQSIEIHLHIDGEKKETVIMSTSFEMNSIRREQETSLGPLHIPFEDPLFFRYLTTCIEAALPTTNIQAITKSDDMISVSLEEIQPDSPWFDLYRAVLEKVCIFIIIPDDPFYWDLSMF